MRTADDSHILIFDWDSLPYLCSLPGACAFATYSPGARKKYATKPKSEGGSIAAYCGRHDEISGANRIIRVPEKKECRMVLLQETI